MPSHFILQILTGWLDLSELEFNAFGFCSVPVGGGMFLRVIDHSARDETLVILDIAEVPPERRELVSQLALESNGAMRLAGQFPLGLASSTGRLSASHTFSNHARHDLV